MKKGVLDKIYEPQEDSYLLLRNALLHIKKLNISNLDICEIGVGSGVVLLGIGEKFCFNNYFGTDINPYAIEFTKDKANSLGLCVKLTNTSLLDGVEKKFDVILFNTPYLPLEDEEKYEDLSLKDRAIYGGEKGYEVIEAFILQINCKLKNTGSVLMLFSSYSNFLHIEKILCENLFDYEVLEKERYCFEELYCLLIRKSSILCEINDVGVENIKYYAKGKHSRVFIAEYKKREVIIKVGKHKDMQIEGMFLEKLKKSKEVPRIYFKSDNFVVMERVQGCTIKMFLDQENSKRRIVKVLDRVLCFTKSLDSMGVNKFELTNPYKHIFVGDGLEVKFIDFERCIYSLNPKNTTQILQYFVKNQVILKEKGIFLNLDKILDISKRIKKENIDFSFSDLIL